MGICRAKVCYFCRVNKTRNRSGKCTPCMDGFIAQKSALVRKKCKPPTKYSIQFIKQIQTTFLIRSLISAKSPMGLKQEIAQEHSLTLTQVKYLLSVDTWLRMDNPRRQEILATINSSLDSGVK